jgi:hypothetical protein
MRRPLAKLLAAGLIALPLMGHLRAAPAPQDAAQAPQKVTFTGDVVLWAFTINPDKASDYEQVLAKLKEALQKIERPEAKQQAAGWKVIKNPVPQSDGSLLYIHIINPVPNADYTISALVYEAFPDPKERQAFYEQYRAALKAPFFAIQGPLVIDMAK